MFRQLSLIDEENIETTRLHAPISLRWLRITFDADVFSNISAIIETSINERFLFFDVSMFKVKFGIIMYHRIKCFVE